MGLIHNINTWSNKHNPKWLVALRVVLGLSLFIKGFSFIQNSVILSTVIAQTSIIQKAPWLVFFIPWVHILGGSLIIVGLFTRFSSLVQIPILFVAVFFVNASYGFLSGESNLGFSIIVLVLLLIFFVEGGGPLSLDHYFFVNTNEQIKGEPV